MLMRKINVAFITDRMILGHGVDLVIDKIASGLCANGYNCEIFCNNYDETFRKQRPYKLKKLQNIISRNAVDLELKTAKIKLLLNNSGADIFIVNSFPFYSLAGSLGKPVISINYGVVSSQGMPLKRRLFYKYMDFTQNYFYFRKSSEVISISGYLNSRMPAYLRKKSEYIHLGADHYQETEVSAAQIEEFRNRFNVKKDDFLLLYVGRLNPVNQPYKGTKELIELLHMAAGRNNRIKLMMVGFGSGNDEIAIKNEGIISIANAPWEMMPVIYSSCDTYVTCTRWEGFDLPIVEAQSFGKPSVCYNLCAHPEISENGKTGFLVYTKEEFLSRILEIAGDSALASQMSLNAKKNSDNFTWEKTVYKYDLAIKKILSEKSSDFNFSGLADTVKKESKLPKNNTCKGNDVSDVTLSKSESSAGKAPIGDNDALLSESSEIENDASDINTFRSASSTDSTINGNKDTNIADVSTVGNNASAKTFGESETDKGGEITCFKDTRVPDVSVIVINYNSSLPCLMECIKSLKSQTFRNIEIIIVDNASTNGVFDSLPEAIERDAQDKDNSLGSDTPMAEDIKIKFIKNSCNQGLAGAINKALKSIESKYVLISNFDVIYDKYAVEELVRMADKTDDEIIGLAPKIRFSHHKHFIESVGTYLDNSLYDCYQGLGQIDLHQYDVPEKIFGVSFTSAFLKTSAFLENSVGEVDESFFLFYEDFDFCFRAGLAGYKFMTCPLAVVYHKYSYSFREESSAFETKYYYKRLNLLKMMYKNADIKTVNRLLPIETGIMKQNLKDKNLRSVSARILRDLRKSKKHLLKQRALIQLARIVDESEIFKYCRGENNFFDIVKNEPQYSIVNLEKMYRRLFVITGSSKYMEYINYLNIIEQTKFKFETDILRSKLHSKLENEPECIHDFINKL